MKKQTNKIKVLFETFVAGVVYSDFNVHEGRLKRGQRLTLKLEPDNHHDSKAIVVLAGKTKIGYIPAALTYLIHDSKGPFRCEVANFARTNPTHRMILIRVSCREEKKKNTHVLRSF